VDRPLIAIVVAGLAMSALALSGALTLLFGERALERVLLPLVALAAGSLLGGALFHMIPASIAALGNELWVYGLIAAGFALFFCLEQFLHWHHCHRATTRHRQPLTYLLLIADGLHNFIGGLAVGAAFVIDLRLGATTWLAAAAHEVPQELGDFGVLVHGGWPPRRALAFNLLSGLTFPLGGLVAWGASSQIDVAPLIPFAAGNFLYIGAADLIPEVKLHRRWQTNLLHLGALCAGFGLLFVVAVIVG
jgi:zinc and cadmium transporter